LQTPCADERAPAIATSALAKEYDGIVAVRGLTMEVGRGEVFGFLGPNGAGKTTVIKMLLGLVRPTGGAATLLGAPLGDRAVRRRIGYLPELFRYQDWLSAREVLALHCALAQIAASERASRIERALRTVGLAERGDTRVGTFSKGMQQRLGLGVALLGDPAIVFLDEPTSALDPVGRHEVRAIIEEQKRRGTTVFLNSHLLTEVERVCDRVAIVHDGAVVDGGSVAALTRGVGGARFRLSGVSAAVAALLRRNGHAVREDAGWHVVQGLAESEIPDLVAALVTAGARVYAVEPLRASLEDRFLRLLGAEDVDDRYAHSA
jgi:ABC-2 type transport system ATP-binding protein